MMVELFVGGIVSGITVAGHNVVGTPAVRSNSD